MGWRKNVWKETADALTLERKGSVKKGGSGKGKILVGAKDQGKMLRIKREKDNGRVWDEGEVCGREKEAKKSISNERKPMERRRVDTGSECG